jgi:hypothetical protein
LKPKLAFAEELTAGGCVPIDGCGGGEPSTTTVGCEPSIVNEPEAPSSSVVQEYEPSDAEAVASKLTVSTPPGQSSLAVSAGEVTSMRELPTSTVAVQDAAVQLPEAVVEAPRPDESTVNPAGIAIVAWFALSTDPPLFASVIV